jgi:polyisoprenoid-binding protein YceI
VALKAGTHRLGPHNATLSVHTRRGGAAAKAGHDLVIHVTSWEGTLEVADDPSDTRVELAADATSLRVHEGTGGMQALGDDDRANIHQTIDDEVLRRQDIAFRSTGARRENDGSAIAVEGDLTLVGVTRPVEFTLAVDDAGRLSARAVVTQSRWGIKPYSALFGALKVLDEVEVVLDGHRQGQSR